MRGCLSRGARGRAPSGRGREGRPSRRGRKERRRRVVRGCLDTLRTGRGTASSTRCGSTTAVREEHAGPRGGEAASAAEHGAIVRRRRVIGKEWPSPLRQTEDDAGPGPCAGRRSDVPRKAVPLPLMSSSGRGTTEAGGNASASHVRWRSVPASPEASVGRADVRSGRQGPPARRGPRDGAFLVDLDPPGRGRHRGRSRRR